MEIAQAGVGRPGRAMLCGEKSHADRSRCGLNSSENAGMSSENCVRIAMAENLRFPGAGSSAPGKPELRRGRKA